MTDQNQEMNEKAIDGSIKDEKANQRARRQECLSPFMRSCNCIHIASILFDQNNLQPAAGMQQKLMSASHL